MVLLLGLSGETNGQVIEAVKVPGEHVACKM